MSASLRVNVKQLSVGFQPKAEDPVVYEVRMGKDDRLVAEVDHYPTPEDILWLELNIVWRLAGDRP